MFKVPRKTSLTLSRLTLDGLLSHLTLYASLLTVFLSCQFRNGLLDPVNALFDDIH